MSGGDLISGTVSMEPPMYSDSSRCILPDPRPGAGWRPGPGHPHHVHPAHRPGQGVHRREKSRFTLTVLGYPVGILSKRWHFLALV